MLLLPLLLTIALPQDPPEPEQLEPAPYLRLVEQEEGLKLEVATRRFSHTREDASDTVVSLVGVMHIADEGYYDALQELLDAHDIVLFEQVAEQDPGSHLVEESADQRARVAATYRRMATLLGSAALYMKDVGRAPETVASLLDAAQDQRLRSKIERAMSDGWGRPILIEHPAVGDDLRAVSLGSDGEPGGTGLAKDLVLSSSEAPPLEARGLQKTMADALGLIFQLEGIDYSSSRWRRCDVTISELQGLLSERGADASVLLSALQGGSMLEGLASGLLKFVGATRSGRGMLKLVGIEALARADELMASPPPGFEGLFEVLLERRNDVVLEDLSNLLQDEPEVESVAVFYGAGHMADLGKRLVADLGLTPLDDSWLPAVGLTFKDTGLPRGQIRLMRRTINQAIERQLSMDR